MSLNKRPQNKITPPNYESRNPFAHYDPQGRKDICQLYNTINGNNGTLTSGAVTGRAMMSKGLVSVILGQASIVLWATQVSLALYEAGMESAGAGCGQQN